MVRTTQIQTRRTRARGAQTTTETSGETSSEEEDDEFVSPNDTLDVYDRRYPPLMVHPTPKEWEVWKESMKAIIPEYWRMSRIPHTTWKTVLLNGMTLGECAMRIICDYNDRRKGYM